ncbi:MAG TPA: hypothetical protein VFD07_14035 [Candidatus Krumholzibacteria bacterium]|nr:hypothetical protein [Candidatus Krumholzibacteria bacterium]
MASYASAFLARKALIGVVLAMRDGMKRSRGTAVFVIMFLILAILGLALFAVAPQRDLGDVKTVFVNDMVAALDGVLHRCGLGPNVSLGENAWVGIAALGAGLGLLAYLRQGRSP